MLNEHLMKKILFLILIIFSLISHSQTLTQNFNEPKPGDVEQTYPLDTSAFLNGMPITITGTNAVWNFTNFVATNPGIDNYYLSPASNTNSAGFPGCTMVMESENVSTFFKSVTTPTPQTELLGLKSGTLHLIFTNSAIIAKYPISFGTVISDNMSGTFSAFSINGNCSGSITTTADGTGTLNLPNGITYANMLRVKSVQSLNLTAGAFPAGTLKQTIYNYYHGSQKFPVLSITYVVMTPVVGDPTKTGFATGSINAFVVGQEENHLSPLAVKIYPNPARSIVYVDVAGTLHPEKVEIFNHLGQAVFSGVYAGNVDLSGIERGMYTVQITIGQRIVRQKLIRE